MKFDYREVETVSMENFDWKFSNTRVEVYPSESGVNRRPLIANTQKLSPDFMTKWHDDTLSLRPEPSPSVGAFFARNVTVFRHGNCSLDGEFLLDECFFPQYAQKVAGVADGRFDEMERTRNCKISVVSEPTVVLSGHGVQIYGHFVIEMLPRLFLLEALQKAGMPFRPLFAIDSQAPDWLRDILKNHFGIQSDRLIEFRAGKTGLFLENAIIPEYLRSGRQEGFHPASGPLFSEFSKRVTDNLKIDIPRLYVSRLFFPSRRGRWKCTNELELLEIAVNRFGFYPFFPEKLSFKMQLSHFARARTVIGEFGSAMHNSAFSQGGLNVGCIGAANWAQSQIDTAVGNRNAYLAADTSGEFSIDPAIFTEFLEAIVNGE